MHTKDLFLRDKCRNFYLVTAEETEKIELNRLARYMKAGRFSFASPEHLLRMLGVTPGSVSPLGLVHDRNHEVLFLLDRRLAQAPILNVHPLRNDHTVVLSGASLLGFLTQNGHEAQLIDFDVLTVDS